MEDSNYSGMVSSGAGISWQRWFGTTGLAITAGGIYRPEVDDLWDNTNTLDYNLQIQLGRMLHFFNFGEHISGNLQWVSMFGHRGLIPTDRQEWNPELSAIGTIPGGDLQTHFFVGTGLAIEWLAFGLRPSVFGVRHHVQLKREPADPGTMLRFSPSLPILSIRSGRAGKDES